MWGGNFQGDYFRSPFVGEEGLLPPMNTRHLLSRFASLLRVVLCVVIWLGSAVGMVRAASDETVLFPFGSTWSWQHPLNGQDPEVTQSGFQANWMKASWGNLPNSGTGIHRDIPRKETERHSHE